MFGCLRRCRSQWRASEPNPAKDFGRILDEPLAQDQIPAPIFILDGIERRQTLDAEPLGQDRVRLVDSQLENGSQGHGVA